MKIPGFCLLLLLLCSVGFAQTASQQESLLIGPGDLLHVQFFQTPDLEQHVRVTDAGTIELLTGDTVTVAHSGPAQAAHAIESDMIAKNWMLSPHVTVTIEQYATQNVTILGQVKSPGAYAISTPRSVLDMLALAGGLTEIANRQVTIQRYKSKERISYLASNDSQVALASAPKVYPGDSIVVPKADTVYVLGDVPRPGGYVNSTNDGRLSVLQVISQAGSTPPNAVPSKAVIKRKQSDGTYVNLPLPLAAMQKGKHPDMIVQPNDIIYVPFSYVRNIATDLGGLIASTGSSAIYVAK